MAIAMFRFIIIHEASIIDYMDTEMGKVEQEIKNK